MEKQPARTCSGDCYSRLAILPDLSLVLMEGKKNRAALLVSKSDM
jgi:hypothetical protein